MQDNNHSCYIGCIAPFILFNFLILSLHWIMDQNMKTEDIGIMTTRSIFWCYQYICFCVDGRICETLYQLYDEMINPIFTNKFLTPLKVKIVSNYILSLIPFTKSNSVNWKFKRQKTINAEQQSDRTKSSYLQR